MRKFDKEISESAILSSMIAKAVRRARDDEEVGKILEHVSISRESSSSSLCLDGVHTTRSTPRPVRVTLDNES
ncbi:hypothetical protein Trydic_g21297 [Trypoxylus dichotomus]